MFSIFAIILMEWQLWRFKIARMSKISCAQRTKEAANKIKTGFDTEYNVFLVFFAEKRHRKVYSRDIDPFAVADDASVYDFSHNFAGGKTLDTQLN